MKEMQDAGCEVSEEILAYAICINSKKSGYDSWNANANGYRLIIPWLYAPIQKVPYLYLGKVLKFHQSSF